MSPNRFLAVAASSVVLVFSGCTTSTKSSTREQPATSLAPTTLAPTTLPADTSGTHHVAETPESRALAKKLVASIQGYEVQPDSVGDTGPSDLDKTVDDSGGGSDARAVLVKEGFVVGYQRYFVRSSNDRGIVVFAYQFGSPSGAQRFADWVVKTGLEPQDGVAPKPLADPDIPGAAGFESTSDGVTSHTVVFTKGTYVVLILTNAKDGDTGSPTAAEVAKQQYDLL